MAPADIFHIDIFSLHFRDGAFRDVSDFFIVLPKRWGVERTLGWIDRARRLSKDFEATIESALASLQLALASLARAKAGQM